MNRKTRILGAIGSAILIIVLALPSHAATIHVPGQQPTIQAGIEAASEGDTVVVASGTYYEHDIVLKSGVRLRSETGEADCVTIDAQGRYMACIIQCVGVDASTSITGFTITGAWHANGGGMKCLRGASPTLTNIVFAQNISDYGGALYCSNASPVLRNVTFRGNWAYLAGGGMYCESSSPALADCTFTNNTADVDGGGLCARVGSLPALSGCTFTGNTAGNSGGGMCCHDNSCPTVIDCTFSGNSAETGSAMCCADDSSPTVVGCTFSGNVEASVVPASGSERLPVAGSGVESGPASAGESHTNS